MSSVPVQIKSSHKRSVVKSVTFRIVVVTSDMLVIFFLTHKVDQTIALTIMTNIMSTMLYYGHERVWDAIRWGRIRVKKG